jgi:hypothetical protein
MHMEHPDVDSLIRELVRSKKELDMAQNQFDTATDPALIDHVVFRLGAAERHFRYLLNYARKNHLTTNGAHPLWTQNLD